MSVFVISDLHLSLNEKTNKSMEVFGRRWQDYVKKLNENWRAVVSERDTVIIPGDISWGLTPEEATKDFLFLEDLPGKKIVGKGNHDFWWQTMSKLDAFKDKNGLCSISFLYNNAFAVENLIICGTRGWFYDASCDNIPKETDFAKISAREAIRLRMSLDAGKKLQDGHPERELLVFLHFPAVFAGKESEEIVAVLKEYGVKTCYYGHIHGSYDVPAEFEQDGIRYIMTSADFLHFVPKIIPQSQNL